MDKLIKTEIFKKRKHCLYMLIFGLLPIFYSLGMKYNWSFVVIGDGKINLIDFCDAMWELLFILGIPLTYFIFFSANILGGEISNGQILLEVPKAKNRRAVVCSKAITTIIMLVYFLIAMMTISAACYYINVVNTNFAADVSETIDAGARDLCIAIFLEFLYYLMMCMTALIISINISSVASTLTVMAIHVVLKVLSNIDSISSFIPGSLVLNSDIALNPRGIIVQIVYICVLSVSMIGLAVFSFDKKDL